MVARDSNRLAGRYSLTLARRGRVVKLKRERLVGAGYGVWSGFFLAQRRGGGKDAKGAGRFGLEVLRLLFCYLEILEPAAGEVVLVEEADF
jgi:hypothetical protein